jgi:ankyrin repeat protein
LIESHGANPNALNGNGSNIAHILFANFQQDIEQAQRLTSKFPAYKVNINLVDNNGLAPLHVAVKKF